MEKELWWPRIPVELHRSGFAQLVIVLSYLQSWSSVFLEHSSQTSMLSLFSRV